ncbi:MAG: hypothetical protein GKR95_08010 [Gammaproteobacteria bacterium]|nr:hypothetical protein [Gammaproteobacteria bacterium]
MANEIENGEIRKFNGVDHIFYDDYWIRYYQPPEETLSEKKKLLDALTRRTFHHTESGINTPGSKLENARMAFDNEQDPQRKRINAAMLAGALFNRATDIFTAIVDLEQSGIHITRQNELMRQCSECFLEALSLSQNVKHHSGEEGVDELWGEPVKVFTMTIADYYSSRYRKIALAMREIDHIGRSIHKTLCDQPWFCNASELVDDFIKIAKNECEVLRSDPDYFSIWPEFVADGEKITEFLAEIPRDASVELERHIKRGVLLLRSGKDIISWIANVRVPIPVSTQRYLAQCKKYHEDTHQLLTSF